MLKAKDVYLKYLVLLLADTYVRAITVNMENIGN